MIENRKKEDTRGKILKAALKLFVKNGFEGTSISDIAKAAAINQSLIYHHFSNKEGLWKEVKLYMLEKSTSAEALKPDLKKGLKGFLEQVITQRFNFYDQNPEVIRLAAWQRLEDKKSALAGGNPAYPGLWKEAILSLQECGEIRKDLDPELVIAMIVSLISGAFTERYGGLQESEKKRKEYIASIIQCLEKGLK